MKTSRYILTIVFTIIAGVSTINAQSKQEKKEAIEKAIIEKVTSGKYKIEVSTAYPRRGKVVNLSSSYSLEIRNDSVISHLPYYGRAYSIPYGGGNGLIFKAPIDEYKMETNKKGAMKVNLIARSPEDRFKYTLTIYPNGSASIDVNMQNRESINFLGEVE